MRRQVVAHAVRYRTALIAPMATRARMPQALTLLPVLVALLTLGACGGGGGGNSSSSSSATEITGNVSQQTAWVSPGLERKHSREGLFQRWTLVSPAYAHSGVNGLDVCAETCPVGLDASDRCPDPQPTDFCSQTDDNGFFTVQGDMSGDLCVRVSDPDEPGFLGRTCVRDVPSGALVNMANMNCSRGEQMCQPAQMNMRGPEQMNMGGTM